MSDERTKAELVADAADYGLSTDGNKTDLLERVLAFEDGGVVDAPVVEPVEVVEAAAEVAPPVPDTYLVKYERLNPVYQAAGKMFTPQNPYHKVTEEQAEHLIHVIGGFRMASPSEVKSYYA